MTEPAPESIRFNDYQFFTRGQVEAALCVHEWLWEADVRDNHPQVRSWWDGLGSAGMRSCAIQAGDICDRAYAHMMTLGYEYHDAYDLEFVPMVCKMIDWDALCKDNQYNDGRYEPDIDALVVAMIAADKAAYIDPDMRLFSRSELTPDKYVTKCREIAEKLWAYGDLVSDHPEKVTAAMESGEDPEAFITALGEKYDLTPVGLW